MPKSLPKKKKKSSPSRDHHSVYVVFLRNPPGRGPAENLLLQVQGIIAEYERTKIMERSRRGKLHAARQGNVNVLGHAPYGYRYVTMVAGGGQARYEVVFEEAQIVRQMFTWIGQERISLSEVCRRLQERQILTRKGLSRWHPATVACLIRNPAFVGQATFGKTRIEPRRPPLRPRRGKSEIPKRPYSVTRKDTNPIAIAVPALVDAALFAAANEQLVENKARYRQPRRGAAYLLQGLLVCPTCGYAWCGQPRYPHKTSSPVDHPGGSYRCSGRMRGKRVEDAPGCNARPIRIGDLDNAVWQDVCQLLSSSVASPGWSMCMLTVFWRKTSSSPRCGNTRNAWHVWKHRRKRWDRRNSNAPSCAW